MPPVENFSNPNTPPSSLSAAEASGALPSSQATPSYRLVSSRRCRNGTSIGAQYRRARACPPRIQLMRRVLEMWKELVAADAVAAEGNLSVTGGEGAGRRSQSAIVNAPMRMAVVIEAWGCPPSACMDTDRE